MGNFTPPLVWYFKIYATMGLVFNCHYYAHIVPAKEFQNIATSVFAEYSFTNKDVFNVLGCTHA